MIRTILRRAVTLGALLCALPAAAQTSRLSELPAASAPAATDIVPLVQGGVTKQTTIQSLISGLPNFTASARGVVPSGGSSSTYLRGDGTWSTPAGGGGGTAAATHPGYISGQWYRVGRYSTAGGQPPADTLLCSPLVIDQATTITSLGVHVTTGQSGSSMYAGIYASNASGRPGTLLAQVTLPLSTSGASSKAALGTPLARSAGIDWACALVSATTTQPTLIGISTVDPQMTVMAGVLDTQGLNTSIQTVSAASVPYSSGLPATAPATTSNSAAPMPLISFRVQ